jgi:hypothetical protein
LTSVGEAHPPERTVVTVDRREGRPDLVDVTVRNEEDRRSIQFELSHREFEGSNPADGSQLTDTVFNISIRLMEFTGIRGFDEFEDGARSSLVTYPEKRQRLPDPEPGVHRNLLSPFWHELRPDTSDTEIGP